MKQYIDKDALVAEINKRITDAPINNIGHQRVWAYNDVKDILDTLDVKEIDLQSEIDRVWDNTSGAFLEDGWKEFEDIAKHFFELGLKTNNPLTWKDMAETVKIANLLEIEWLNSTPWDGIRDCGFYTEVLKQFKAQKGE